MLFKKLNFLNFPPWVAIADLGKAPAIQLIKTQSHIIQSKWEMRPLKPVGKRRDGFLILYKTAIVFNNDEVGGISQANKMMDVNHFTLQWI